MKRLSVPAFLLPSLFWLALVGMQTAWSAERNTEMCRFGSDIQYLASDALEGRGAGTDGLDKAAQFIRTTFENLGLHGAGNDGAYQRPFSIELGSQVVTSKTYLTLHGPAGEEVKLELGTQFQPVASNNPNPLELDLVFAGYGISAPKLGYDDYQDKDLTNKAIVVVRREPQQDDAESVFDGTKATLHSYIRTKLKAAEKSGAAALLLVNDPFTTAKENSDTLSRPGAFGRGTEKIPFMQIKQSVFDQVLQRTPVTRNGAKLKSLAAIAADIDKNLVPMTQALTGWKADFQCTFETSSDEVTNVAALIEGEGPLADETIVIGAHYDHLGFGPYGSRRPHSHEVHNGADDNATGTAAVLELARRYASRVKRPARRLVFVTFTGEERGLLGSNYYLNNPLFPLGQTVAMVNIDMIGHLKDNGLTVGGVASAPEFAAIVQRLSEGIEYKIGTPTTTGGSDHAGFYRNNIPFLFFHTGLTDVYHTPDDDFETLDIDGAVVVIDFAEQVLDELLNLPQRPQFTQIKRSAPRTRRALAYLGITPDYDAQDQNGIPCKAVNPDSPAAKGGVQPGDVIVKIGDVDVLNLQGLRTALGKFKAGEHVQILIHRGAAKKTLDITLGSPGE